MNGWKYILFECDSRTVGITRTDYQALVFHPGLQHAEMARHLAPAGWKPLRAGFIHVAADQGEIRIQTYGHSESLGLKSDPDDADWICE